MTFNLHLKAYTRLMKKYEDFYHGSKIYIFTLFINAVDMQISFYLSIHSCISAKALLFLSDHIFLLYNVMLNFEEKNISWMLKKIFKMSTYLKVLVNNFNIETEIPNKGTKSGVYVN